jgi:hypothetical protein
MNLVTGGTCFLLSEDVYVFEQAGSLPVGSDESILLLAEASNHSHPDLLNQQALSPQLLLTACLTCPGTVEPGNSEHLSAFNIILKILSSHISNHMHGFDLGSTIYFFLKSVFGVTLHAANTEHKQKFFLFVRN